MKASDLFVKCLENEGVEFIFGVPGEENADFMISLEEKATKIKAAIVAAATVALGYLATATDLLQSIVAVLAE